MWRLRYGVPNARYSKPVLFRDTIRETNFEPGSHDGNPQKHGDTTVQWCSGFPNLYHTKWRSWEYGIQRQRAIAARERSAHSRQMGWGFHYSLPEAKHLEYFTVGYRTRLRVL